MGVRVGPQQHDAEFVVERAQHKHLGHERPDLAWREVDDADDQRSLQLLTRVMGDLGGRALDPDLGAEVDRQLPRGLAGLGEFVDSGHPADPHVDRHEVVEVDQPLGVVEEPDGVVDVDVGVVDVEVGVVEVVVELGVVEVELGEVVVEVELGEVELGVVEVELGVD